MIFQEEKKTRSARNRNFWIPVIEQIEEVKYSVHVGLSNQRKTIFGGAAARLTSCGIECSYKSHLAAVSSPL